jgi:5-formyltetrahydrofolate cyclo-ligase
VAGSCPRARRREAAVHGGAPPGPARIDVDPRAASSIKGASAQASTIDVEELAPVDLVVTGCVAVDETGARLGKGGGFSDLELAVAAEAGLVDDRTVVVTTVHERQVRPAGTIPTTGHDIHVDLVVTPDRVLECPRPRGWNPPHLHWDELTPEKIGAIPLLRRLQPGS